MKGFIKSIILFITSIFCRDNAPKSIFYHDIGKKYTDMGTDIDSFWSHMKYLREGDVICFDDGFRGVWDVRKKLSSLKNKIIIFLAVDLVGRPGYLNWNEIKILEKENGIDFQCHTWSHQTLVGPYNDEVSVPKGGRTDAWYRHELIDSKVELEQKIGKAIDSLCLPVGYFSNDVIELCKKAGYAKVFASYPGDVTDDYMQARCLAQDLPAFGLKAVLQGGMNIFKKRYLRMHSFADKGI